jgi:hypothetical protein
VTGNNVTFTGAYYQPNTGLPTGYTFTFTGHFTNPAGWHRRHRDGQRRAKPFRDRRSNQQRVDQLQESRRLRELRARVGEGG